MTLRRLKSDMAPEHMAAAVNESMDKLERMASAVLLPERTPSGETTAGAAGFSPFAVTFTTPDRDHFVSHSVGSIATSWVPTSVRGYASDGARADGHITISDGKGRADSSGFYLRAHFENPINKVELLGFVYTRTRA